MADRIVYKADALEQAMADMEQMAKLLKEVSDGLSHVDTSEEWWSRLKFSPICGASNALGALEALRRETGYARRDAATICSGIRVTRESFEQAEAQVLAMARSLGGISSVEREIRVIRVQQIERRLEEVHSVDLNIDWAWLNKVGIVGTGYSVLAKQEFESFTDSKLSQKMIDGILEQYGNPNYVAELVGNGANLFDKFKEWFGYGDDVAAWAQFCSLAKVAMEVDFEIPSKHVYLDPMYDYSRGLEDKTIMETDAVKSIGKTLKWNKRVYDCVQRFLLIETMDPQKAADLVNSLSESSDGAAKMTADILKSRDNKLECFAKCMLPLATDGAQDAFGKILGKACETNPYAGAVLNATKLGSSGTDFFLNTSGVSEDARYTLRENGLKEEAGKKLRESIEQYKRENNDTNYNKVLNNAEAYYYHSLETLKAYKSTVKNNTESIAGTVGYKWLGNYDPNYLDKSIEYYQSKIAEIGQRRVELKNRT